MYINRTLETKFLKMTDFFKAVLVTGPRQVGKTTMLKHLAKDNRTYVSLDDESARSLAKEDPRLFFMRYKPPILIDEVQKAPELFPYIKMMCDNSEETGLFWLTGSQQFSMMKHITESLAGRVGIMNLHPLSYSEINGVSFSEPLTFELDALLRREAEAAPFDLNTIFEFIWRGGMPQVQLADAEQRSAYYDSYINTYIMRDVTNEGGVSDFYKFSKFLSACAATVGDQLNIANLASITGISAPTASAWLDLLQGLHIVYLLVPYANNKLKRLAKTPKLYFWDTGLCAYLAKWLTKDTLLQGHDCGKYFENYVICELLKELHYSSANFDLSYFRDSNSKEIDLMLETSGLIHPLEIKMSSNPDRREVKKYDVLSKNEIPRGNGGILCMTPTATPISEHDFYIPINLL